MEKHYTKNMGEITYVYGVDLEEHTKVIEKQQQRIAELEQDLEFTTKTANELIEIKHKLEQQLAEKDKEIAHLKEKDNYHLRYEIAGADETITNLKEQLAEKDCRIEELEGQFAYECECNMQLVDLQKQLAEKDKEINSLIADYEKRISQEQELMSNMEHRLAEKQKTIDEINKEFVQAIHDWKTLCAEKDKEIERLKVFEEAYYFNQTQVSQESMDLLLQNAYQVHNETQLAIQELEKVKDT